MREQNLSVRWFTQPANPRTFQARTNGLLSDAEAQQLSFDLMKHCLAFEVSQFSSDPSLFMFETRLGLIQLGLDQAGESVLRLGHLELLLQRSNGSLKEFERLLRVSSGQAWFDLLEPLRAGKFVLEGLRNVG
jgi:hypothetical protein